jgi:uncharacterized membrane protein
MSNSQIEIKFNLLLKKLLQFFFQGLIVLAPIGITIWAIVSLFNVVDSILPNIIHSLFPQWVKKDIEGNIDRIPGLGFLVVVSVVLFVGWISSSFIVRKLVDILDTVLENTPGIKFIYSSVKEFLEAFAGNKKKFEKPVLVNIDGPDVWRLGFVTKEDAKEFDKHEHVIVYVPHSYAISGITFFVPVDKVKILENINAAQAMKFAISGGVTEIVD